MCIPGLPEGRNGLLFLREKLKQRGRTFLCLPNGSLDGWGNLSRLGDAFAVATKSACQIRIVSGNAGAAVLFCGDCHGEIESVFTKDELLTNIMIYWITQTINSSTRLYYETTHQSETVSGRVEVPTGVAVFPAEIPVPPRFFAQRFYDIQRWTEMPVGSHFAALEQL